MSQICRPWSKLDGVEGGIFSVIFLNFIALMTGNSVVIYHLLTQRMYKLINLGHVY
jgi:hypothetical protein